MCSRSACRAGHVASQAVSSPVRSPRSFLTVLKESCSIFPISRPLFPIFHVEDRNLSWATRAIGDLRLRPRIGPVASLSRPAAARPGRCSNRLSLLLTEAKKQREAPSIVICLRICFQTKQKDRHRQIFTKSDQDVRVKWPKELRMIFYARLSK